MRILGDSAADPNSAGCIRFQMMLHVMGDEFAVGCNIAVEKQKDVAVRFVRPCISGGGLVTVLRLEQPANLGLTLELCSEGASCLIFAAAYHEHFEIDVGLAKERFEGLSQEGGPLPCRHNDATANSGRGRVWLTH